MTEEDTSKSNGNDISVIKAVTGLSKTVPIYKDAIQPAAKEAGKVLETVVRSVNVALLPIRGFLWGFEEIEEFVKSRVSKKLENTPVENICEPDPTVAVPALQSLRYTGHKESLSELYANLLASAMDKETAKYAHPSFVEIIRSMSADEAKLFEYIINNDNVPIVDIIRIKLSDKSQILVRELISTLGTDACMEYQEQSDSCLINLDRLGLIEIVRGRFLVKPDAYDRIINDSPVQSIIDKLNEGDEYKGDFNKYFAKASVFGAKFFQACVASREKT